MRVEELFSDVRNTLQDVKKTYWDDSELLRYYNECVKVMAAERLENKTTATLILDPTRNQYDTTGLLRYIRVEDNDGRERPLYPNDSSGDDDANGIIIIDYNKIYVNSPDIGTILTISAVSLPIDSNITSDVRSGDESALKYYMLSKAYEKDFDMGNFKKAGYFYGMYLNMFKSLKSASNASYRSGLADSTEAIYY